MNKRKKSLIGVCLAFFLLSFVIFIYWFFVLRFEESTDDAYVQGDLVELTSQVSGVVSSIYADDTDYVQEGQVLVQLDPTNDRLKLEKSKNELGQIVREVVQMFLKVEELEATLETKELELIKARQDFQNRVHLVEIGGVSQEEFEHVEAQLKIASSSAKETKRALEASYAQIQGTSVETHPLVQEAIEQVKGDWIRLKRCDILSPIDGYVTQRKVQLGEWADVSQPLLAIVPLDQLWVDANFKEIQLARFRIGQEVILRADLYGSGVTYQGKVVGINPGTGNTFSLLPPQNATGNWIKIVQRVPVRISLDRNQIKKHPLWLGLSMKVRVNIKDIRGEVLTETKRVQPIYRTEIYSKQEEGVEKLIQEILKENIGYNGK